MYTGKFRIPTNRFCFKCHHRVFHSDVKDYPYVCPHWLADWQKKKIGFTYRIGNRR